MFKGRMNRFTYLIMLAAIIGIGLLLAIAGLKGAVTEFLFFIIGVPRLHDIGRSGWWMLVLVAVEIAALVLILALLPTAYMMAGVGLTSIIVLGGLVGLGCIPGDAGANEFGEPPAAGFSFSRPALSSGEPQ